MDGITWTCIERETCRQIQINLRGSVDEILERREGTKQALGNELNVAMAHGVHDVEAQEVDVHGALAQSPQSPRPDDGNGEIQRVHQMLRKRMHRPYTHTHTHIHAHKLIKCHNAIH